jgi:hypothetical protein
MRVKESGRNNRRESEIISNNARTMTAGAEGMRVQMWAGIKEGG